MCYKLSVVRVYAFLLCFLPAFWPGSAVHAQTFYSWTEYGVSIGGSQYFGDLNDNHGFHYIRPAGGGFVRLHLNPYIAIRGSVSYTKIGYDDKFNSNEFQKQRNLSFRSDIAEAAIQAEFNFARFSTGELGSRFTPYLTGGIGVFYFNPYTDFQDKRYYLRPLGTEGQNSGFNNRKYQPVSMCFPVGAGFKYWIRPGLNLGLEVADRLTVTDYLDDVSTSYVGSDKFVNDPLNPNPAYYLQDRSAEVNGGISLGKQDKQRGNSETRDQYLYFIFNISLQLKVYKCPGWLKRGELE